MLQISFEKSRSSSDTQVQLGKKAEDNNGVPIAAGKYIFAGPRFRKAGPILAFDTLNDQIARLELPVIGTPLTLKRFKKRLCIGRYDLITSIHQACPRRSLVEEKETHCPDCQRAIGFVPAFYNVTRDQLSSQQQRYNEKRHVVYLAWFGPSLIKVGISSEERRHDRWLEQGAIGATVIFNASDAYEARKFEQMVSSEFKLPEVVRSGAKIHRLFPPPNKDVCMSELGVTRWKIARSVSVPVSQSEIFYGEQYYFFEGFPKREPIDVSGGSPLVISGVGYGIVGDVLIVKQEAEFYCVRLKTFLAHVTEVSSHIVPNADVKMQRRLF
jgi:hypothetical protein